MPINNSGGPVALSSIRTELGLSSKTDFKLDGAENGDITIGYVPINLCSTLKPSSADPTSFSEWRGYDHNTACNSTKLGMVYCNYTPSTDICNLTFGTPASVEPTTGTTSSQDTSTALTYVGCSLWDLYVGSSSATLANADYEWQAKLTFSTDDTTTNWIVQPSTVNSVRHYPTNQVSAPNCYLIAAYGVSSGGYGFVRTAVNIYKIMQDYSTQQNYYVHVYGRRRTTSAPQSDYIPLVYNQRKQTLVNRPAVNGVDFGITIPESNNTSTSFYFSSTDLNFKRVGYFRYNKVTDTTTWVTI